MKYDEFVSIYIVHINRSVQNQGLSEEKKKRILEAKVLREGSNRESHHGLQCFSIPEIFLIAMECILIHATKSTDEIIFHGQFLGILQRYACSKKIFFFFSMIFLFKSTGFSIQLLHPRLQQSEDLCNGFFFFFFCKKTIFL